MLLPNVSSIFQKLLLVQWDRRCLPHGWQGEGREARRGRLEQRHVCRGLIVNLNAWFIPPFRGRESYLLSMKEQLPRDLRVLPYGSTTLGTIQEAYCPRVTVTLLRTSSPLGSEHVLAARPWHTGQLFVSRHAVVLSSFFRFDVLV